MGKRWIVCFLIAAMCGVLWGGLPVSAEEMGTLSGKVMDKTTGQPVVGASVMLKGTSAGVVTDEEGQYRLERIEVGNYTVVVRRIGYAVFAGKVHVEAGEAALDVALSPAPIELSEIVVTATRTEKPVEEIPANVTVISRSTLQNQSGLSTDDFIAAEPGVDVRRSSGMFTMSPKITLRGTSGDEPSRTLVMVDGVPINKTDTGGVNWNRIKPEDIERIEIVRGPASAVYGAGAMGGVINIITRLATDGGQGHVTLKGGTFGTYGSDLSISAGRALGPDQFLNLYLSGTLLKSDGYISDPEEERTDYTIKRFLDENSQTVKLTVRTGLHEVVATYQRYDDERGEGTKIQAPDGEFRDFDTDFVSLRYGGAKSGWNWEAKGFYQLEQYARIDERMKKGNYTRFDVLSDRKDMGFLSNVSFQAGRLGTCSAGVDGKKGSVDGADTYRTSDDIVANEGVMTSVSAFVQDEMSVLDGRLNFVAGARFDRVSFSDGHINSSMPPWDTYNGDLDENTWSEVCPRLGISYRASETTRLYASFGKAFRGSILDDLCRSGWMWVGPKIANPYLEPEVMYNVEGGVQQSLGRALVKLTGYYAQGRDFLYYVDTGEKLWGKKTLWQRKNVAKVHLTGVEASARVPIGATFCVSAGFTGTRSVIKEFPERQDLEDKTLTYVPEVKGSLALDFHKFLDGTLTWELVGKQYSDDKNEQSIPGYGVVHLKASRKLVPGLRLGVDVRNILDKQYLQSTTSLDPGRTILGTVSYDLQRP
ncbi:MAG: TonB-dependent receptor [Candidatus Latescibacteria bacterium]|nr:TonB-dependent receptor [Candidatus Latescibacterota bacterium]